MQGFDPATLTVHLGLAGVLFFLVNWIGKHAVDFGYISTTLFEEANESVALNFFLRALSPAIFIVMLSAVFVSTSQPNLRLNIYIVAIYYYILRAVVIFLLNRQRLISWSRYVAHALVGITAAKIAYAYLILPNRSLLPDLQNAGNELWLAIFAFLYAVANKVPMAGGPGARRRNRFVSIHYIEAKKKFGSTINTRIDNETLKLIAYAILIYEDYARPAAVREIERLIFWKDRRSTGIMQVQESYSLTDAESVERGADKLANAWASDVTSSSNWERVRAVIADYNRDDDYITRVCEVMDIIANRVDLGFQDAYNSIWSE
jgi:hypothetical protein